MSTIIFSNISKHEGLIDAAQPLKLRMEERINLEKLSGTVPVTMQSLNMVFRLALMASLSDAKSKRNPVTLTELKLKDHIHDTCFNWNNLQPLWSALLKLRWNSSNPDWENHGLKSRIINWEIMNGIQLLKSKQTVEEWLTYSAPSTGSNGGNIPRLLLDIGEYEGGIPAKLDLNGRSIPNTQVLIAGTTGSGKSNLIAVLINEIRQLSVESPRPLNFLLFDYKGEFSDPANSTWLPLFEVDKTAILRPVERPLPFTPFRDFVGKPQNEINLYATELATALCSIDKAVISANMSNRLTEAVINAYNATIGKPVTFQIILESYVALLSERDREKMDSVRSVLAQLIRCNLFAESDIANIIGQSMIIKMDDFPKDGPIATAIVYFIISKLNTLYEKLPKQEVNAECVELRHFTIIDEAHYMLDFDNKPLRDLIAVGRNKGLSIILATQNMESYKSRYFDFYANAQYPLIMRQQTISDGVIKDIFGVTGSEFHEIKEVIAGLKMGELIIKDNSAVALGLGKKFKKLKVRHLI